MGCFVVLLYLYGLLLDTYTCFVFESLDYDLLFVFFKLFMLTLYRSTPHSIAEMRGGKGGGSEVNEEIDL